MNDSNTLASIPALVRWTNTKLLALAFLVRVFLILYAHIHDYLFKVNFTDVDYEVFSDAAYLVLQGKSPYVHATYRYMPFVSWMLTPNYYFPDFGKFLFCALDIFAGWFHFRIAGLDSTSNDVRIQNRSRWAVIIFWLFNPFIAIISARGNADSIICAIMLATLFSFGRAKRDNFWFIGAAFIYGAGSTLRIFPIIYMPSVFLSLASSSSHILQFSHFMRNMLVNWRGFYFVLLSVVSFALPVGLFYTIYGNNFVNAAFLYHLTRVDIRHNFSPYFLPLYLTLDSDGIAKLIGLTAFAPQIGCIVVFALRYSNDLPFCWFLTTFAFVSLNKVFTSQYFVWYLCFLPLLSNRIKIDCHDVCLLFSLWLLGQALWLLPAFLLEHLGCSSFIFVWISSILFLLINVHIIGKFIRAYVPIGKKRVKLL